VGSRLTISIVVSDDEILVVAEENGRFRDEAEFHPSEKYEVVDHVELLVETFLNRVIEDRTD